LGSRWLRKCYLKLYINVRILCGILVFSPQLHAVCRRSATSLFGPSNRPIYLHFLQILYHLCRTLLGGRCCTLLCITQKTSIAGAIASNHILYSHVLCYLARSPSTRKLWTVVLLQRPLPMCVEHFRSRQRQGDVCRNRPFLRSCKPCTRSL